MDPVTICVVAAAAWFVAPSKDQVLGGDEPQVSAAAQVAVEKVDNSGRLVELWRDAAERALERQDELQKRLDEAARNESVARGRVEKSAQETNQMVIDVLLSIAPDKRTPETILAAILAQKTDAALSGLVGELTRERQLELAALWKGLLDQNERIRVDAEEKLRKMDEERNAALRERAEAVGRVQGLAEALDGQRVVARDAMEREKAAVADMRWQIDGLRETMNDAVARAGSDVWFWRLWLFGFAGVLFVCGRVIPRAAEVWPWLGPVNKFNAFVFRVLTGREIR